MLKSGKKLVTLSLAAIIALGMAMASFAASGTQTKSAPPAPPAMAKPAPAAKHKAKHKARHKARKARRAKKHLAHVASRRRPAHRAAKANALKAKSITKESY